KDRPDHIFFPSIGGPNRTGTENSTENLSDVARAHSVGPPSIWGCFFGVGFLTEPWRGRSLDMRVKREFLVAKRRTTTTVRTGTLTARKLTEAEEKVVRMSKGIAAADELPLEAKTSNPELLQALRDIEAKLFLEADQLPALSKKQRIIDRLKK